MINPALRDCTNCLHFDGATCFTCADYNLWEPTTIQAAQKRWATQTRYMPMQEAKESDPNGKSPNAPGAKLDAGKNRLWLVLGGFSRALQEVGKVGTFGANKYTDNGWMGVPDGVDRYTDAMFRHLMKEAAGEEFDPETNLLHAAHAAWNALARLDLMIRNKGE